MQRLIQRMMLAVLLGLTACQSMQSQPEKLPANIQLGGNYYTQVTMQYEKGQYRTSNYRKGELMPMNTEVELLAINPKTMRVKILNSNVELLVQNIQKHTGNDVYQAFEKLFASQPLNLNKFSRLERQNIAEAKADIGMTKEAVLVAIGYPPITRTPSLDADEWRYWSNRFNTFVVHFTNGAVSRIQN